MHSTGTKTEKTNKINVLNDNKQNEKHKPFTQKKDSK